MNDALDRVVERWRTIKDAEVAAGLMDPSCCVLASKVLVVELTANGIDAWAEPTYSLVWNAAANPYVGKVHVSEWPPEAWSIGIDPDRKPDGRYPGHLVVMAHVDDRLVLIDGSAGQFSRPEHDMNLPSVMVGDADGWPDRHPIYTDHGSRWTLTYFPAPLGQQHRVAPDWTRNWRRHTQAMRGQNA